MSGVGDTAAIPAMTASDALARVAAREFVLVDVREPHEWEAGHSPEARSLPMSQLGERVAEVPTDHRLAIVCHLGSRSARVTAALIDAGFDAVNVEGGMVAWVGAGGQIVRDGPGEPTVD